VSDLALVLLGGIAVAFVVWLIDRGIRAAERDFDNY
jgi:hypothetical protein